MAHGLGGSPHVVTVDLPPEISSLSELEMLVRYQQKAFLYSAVAMTTLLVYDYLITLNMEAKYVWKSKDRISVTNVLFFLNRYLPIARSVGFLVFSLNPPNNYVDCSNWTDANSYTTMIGVAIVETLMLLRAWALWGRSRPVGIFLSCLMVGALVGCVVTVKSDFGAYSPVPHVVALPPMSIQPCDRPSPYKYMATYCIALLIELVSFGFMMGRIMYLIVKSKANSRRGAPSRGRSLALPLIKGLQLHGASYFAAVIYVMSFSIICSFIGPLARAVVNAGVAPTITSIACNRVIFTLRGLYMDVTIGGGETTHRTPSTNHPRAPAPYAHNKPRADTPEDHAGKKHGTPGLEKALETTNYEYDDEIAVTRNDIQTKDLTAGADYQLQYRDRDEERGQDSGESAEMYQGRRLIFPGVRPAGLGTPFHAHGQSSSTVLSDDSVDGEDVLPRHQADAYHQSHTHGRGFGHAMRGTSRSSFKFLGSPGSASSHTPAGGAGSSIMSRATTAVGTSSMNAGAMSSAGPVKRSMSSLSGMIRSPTREESGAGFDDTPEDVARPISPRVQGITEKLGSIWRIKRDGKDGASRGGQGLYDGGNTTSLGPDVSRERSRTREREKDRHPLDHHYEMETIHSELMHEHEWSLPELEPTEEDVPTASPLPREEQHPPRGMQGNATWTRTGIGESDSFEGDPASGTPYLSRRAFEQSLFYQEPR